MTTALLALLLATTGSVCPASQQPGWQGATPLQRRTMLRACAAEQADPAPALPLAPEATPQVAPAGPWHPAARITLQAVTGLAVTAGSLALLIGVGSSPDVSRLALPVLLPVGLVVTPALVGASAYLAGWLTGGRGHLGWTLLGSLLGTTVVVGAFLVGQATINVDAGGGVLPALVASVCPTIGSIVAYELSSRGERAPSVAFAPRPGGGLLLVSVPL